MKSWFKNSSPSITPFQNAGTVINDYNQALQNNALTQASWNKLLADSDDSLKAYLASIKGTTASTSGYMISLQGNITGFKKVSSAITKYNSTAAADQESFANAISATNTKLGNYLSGLNGANASLGGYMISLIGATVKTVAFKAAAIALNSALTMGVSFIISGIVSAVSSYINRAEIITKKAEEAKEKIRSLNQELKENQTFISDSAKRYAALAQGVDQLTGKNVSLNMKDYEEFLSLSNQLAEMFPTLNRNIDSNGNAIVQLSGNVDTIVESLYHLVDAERAAVNKQTADELPTVFDDVASKSDAYITELQKLEDKKMLYFRNWIHLLLTDCSSKSRMG